MNEIKCERLGHFDVPRPQGADERFGFGLAALSLTPRGTLWASGKITRGLVAGITIPFADETEGPVETAEIVTPWFGPADGLYGELRRMKLDRLGGLIERDGWLYSLHYTYYGTGDIDALDVPTLLRRDIRSWEAAEGPWHIGPPEHPYHQKATSHYLFESPDGRVYCGRGDGAGNANAPHGPALFRFSLETPADAEVLLYRDAVHAPSWWSPVDKWTGGAWLKVPGGIPGGAAGPRTGEGPPGTVFTERVAFCGSKDTTLMYWYGTGDLPDEKPDWFDPLLEGDAWIENWKASGYRDPWHKSRGYHCLDRAVVLQLYDPADLGPGRHPAPELIALPGFHPASQVAGMAYDHARQLLYVGEVWPPENMEGKQAGEWPRIHVYAVSATATEPTPPPKATEVWIDIQGVGTFSGSGVWRKA